MKPASLCSPARARGFTLIELMIGVVVAATLVGLAAPSFLQQLRQSRRTDAVAAVTAVQQAQERWRAGNTAYAGTLAALGLTSASSAGYYTLTLSGATATGYTLGVAANAGTSQAKDSGCSSLSVVVADGAATRSPAKCWGGS
jgi:type IV pilus assembly protein PilE